MPEIEPIFRVLPKLLKPNGIFVFSLMHPAFNNPSATLPAEEWDDGQIHTRYAVKVPRYINRFQSQGLALLNQPKPQLYFHRPIRDYMNFALPKRIRPRRLRRTRLSTLGWGGKFNEIPPALIVRMRLRQL